MADSQDLLTATAALLAIGLGLHVPALTARIPRVAWGLAGLGALLPLLDVAAAHLSADDQIGALTRAPFFAGPPAGYGVIVIAALAVAVWSGLRSAGLALGALAAGYTIYLLLAAATAPGVPWLAPMNPVRHGWSLFPQGHPVLIALLALSLLGLEALGGRIRWLHRGAAGLLAAYGVFAVGGYLWAAVAAPPAPALPGGEFTRRTVEPDGWLPHRWRVVDETPGEYRVTLLSLGGEAPPEPKAVARWNDEGLLLAALDDPVVFRLYRRAFLHPVAEVAVSSSQTVLTVQELSHRLAESEGPAFVLKTDSDGRNRLYRLERFD